jgi:magnesium transporter
VETATELLRNEWVTWALADLSAGRTAELREALRDLHVAEIADLLEAMPPEQRVALWDAVPRELAADILPFLHDEARNTIIEEMDHRELVAAAERMDVEDLADVIEELPRDLSDTILEALEQDHRARLEVVLAYAEDSAGRLMSADTLSVRPDVSLAVVLRWLRRQAKLPPHTDALTVIDTEGTFLGTLSMEAIVTGEPDDLVGSAMAPSADVVRVNETEHEVAALFDRRDLISVPVVDETNKLLGRITIDDVVDVIREEADRFLMNSAGLDEEEDLFAPIIPSAQRRGVWLGVNLLTVFLAAWVISHFEEALDKIVALAVLMPVVASMGGIAGSQTLTLTIRGMALGQIARGNVRWLTVKELAVGALNGAAWAVVVAAVAYLWFGDLGISAVIATAMVVNMLAAALAGITVPLTLKRMGIDPALSGTVVLTTVTDVIGFLSFLGLASLFLL